MSRPWVLGGSARRGGRPLKLTTQILSLMRARYEAGESARSIAADAGVTYAAVYYHARKRGWSRVGEAPKP